MQLRQTEIENKILEVGGNDYKNKKSDLEELCKKLIFIEKQISKYKQTLQNSESNMEQHEKEINELDQ